MQNNPLIIIIIVGAITAIIGAIAGYLGAVLEHRLNKALDDAREITDPNDPNYESHKPVPNVGEHDILKVTIDPALQLHLALDGVDVVPDSLTAEQRTRLVNVIIQIRPWIDGKTSPAAAPITPVAPPPEPTFSKPLSFPPPLSVQPPTVAPAARVDMRRGFRTLLESDIKKPEPLLKNNIISLIDEVLQKKLEASPLASRRIRLEEGPQGEVIVFVGSARYIGIDSVPDQEIRTIIQAAIKEWNDK